MSLGTYQRGFSSLLGFLLYPSLSSRISFLTSPPPHFVLSSSTEKDYPPPVKLDFPLCPPSFLPSFLSGVPSRDYATPPGKFDDAICSRCSRTSRFCSVFRPRSPYRLRPQRGREIVFPEGRRKFFPPLIHQKTSLFHAGSFSVSLPFSARTLRLK